MGERRFPVVLERLLLLVVSPLLFLGLSELAIRALGVRTDLARNEDSQIALPVWLLADEAWVSDRQSKMRRGGGEPIAAEEVAWLYHFEEARFIQYKLKPDVDVEAVNPFNEIEVAKQVKFRLSSNRDGFRERPFSPKAPGTIRIVTLGDSSTFGWGVNVEHTYQRLLEDRLEQHLPGRIEVLNLGIPGHNTRHGLGMLRHYALQLEPDLLIVSYGANDPRRVPTPTDAVLAADETWRGAMRFGLLRLRTYQLLRRVILTAANPLRAKPADGAGPVRVRAVARDDYVENLRTMTRLAAEAGAETIFMSVCTGERQYAAAMRDLAAELNVPSLDVRSLFGERIDALIAGELHPEKVARYRALYGRAMDTRRSFFVTSDGCHPHWVGHSLIAEEMVEFVRESLGLPSFAASNSGDNP